MKTKRGENYMRKRNIKQNNNTIFYIASVVMVIIIITLTILIILREPETPALGGGERRGSGRAHTDWVTRHWKESWFQSGKWLRLQVIS